jgi:ABC-2 type transport system ATP-binding protein
MGATGPVLELTHVTKTYGKSRGVEDVSFAVQPGTVFGFLGPNGAGKTTTISLLVDLLRPTEGNIKIFGLDSVRDSVEIRRRVGFLAGDMAMDRGLTGWQQLEYLGNLRGAFDKNYVRELAERLDCRLERKFKTLSRGNKQKVGLIAALMNKPELLILDEPTSGLDPLIQAEFNALALDHKKAGKTVFISSHVLSEVQEICDSVTFIREGKIIETKTMESLGRELPKVFALRSADKSLQALIKKLPGVSSAHGTNGHLRGEYLGDINELLKIVAKHKVKDFSVHDADLETVFMKYYEARDA